MFEKNPTKWQILKYSIGPLFCVHLFCKGSPYFLRFSVFWNYKIRETYYALVYKNKGPLFFTIFGFLNLKIRPLTEIRSKGFLGEEIDIFYFRVNTSKFTITSIFIRFNLYHIIYKNPLKKVFLTKSIIDQ